MKSKFYLLLIIFTSISACQIEKTLKKASPDQLADALESKDRNKLMKRGSQIKEDSLKNSWPGETPFVQGELGFALQTKFRQHADVCGFTFGDNPGGDTTKNYLPADISNFVKITDLKKSAEIVDINGNGLLFYMFEKSEVSESLEDQSFSSQKIIDLDIANQFLISTQPDQNFDSYLLTKTCRGILDASLEAGAEPPYSSFKAAVAMQNRKEATIVVVSGTFESPLNRIKETSEFKTRAYLAVWQCYLNFPSYIDQAYYLSEFEGVMIKRVASNKEFNELRLAGKLDFSGPMSSEVKSHIGFESESSTLFKATDWETIIVTDFNNENERNEMFRELPSVDKITNYFNNLNPILESNDNMVQGAIHEVSVSYEGIPSSLTDKENWKLVQFPQLYKNDPELHTLVYKEGEKQYTKFIIKGIPKDDFFEGRSSEEQKSEFKIESSESLLADKHLEIKFSTTIGFSKHPIPIISSQAVWEPYSLADGRNYGSKWRIRIQFNDINNPVNFNVQASLNNPEVKKPNGDLLTVTPRIKKDIDEKWFEIILYDPVPRKLSDYSDEIEDMYNFTGVLKIPINGNNFVNRTIHVKIPYPKLNIQN